MFEAALRRLVLAVDTVDIVDTVPFGPEAVPMAVERLPGVRKRLAVHHKEEAQSADPQVPPNLERSSQLQTHRVPPYRNRRL